MRHLKKICETNAGQIKEQDVSNQFIDTKNETSPVPEEFAKKPFF